MNDTITQLGAACIALSLLFALAGLGWWRLAVALLASLVIAAFAAGGVGWVVWKVAFSFEHGGGEWRGLGSLAVAVIATGVVFLVVFVLLMIVLAVTRRAIFRRASASWVVLGISVLLFVGGIGAFELNTPQHTSTERLVNRVRDNPASVENESELVRRGAPVVPVILAEVHRHPYTRDDNFAPSQVPQLLRVLGRIGGGEANMELQKWAESDAYEGIRVAAVVAIAGQGNRTAIPLIVKFLAKHDGQWPWHRRELLGALGRLKAADQVGTILDAMSDESSNRDSQLVTAGLSALVAIDTDSAWDAITEMSAKGDNRRRSEVLTALQKFPGARTVKLAAAALDDQEPSIREAGFWTLYRIEPTLFTGLAFGWSEENGKKVRDALRSREPKKP